MTPPESARHLPHPDRVPRPVCARSPEPAPMATTDSKLTAADLMTPAPRTCTTFSSVLEAVLIFRDADCGAVPVLENGKPVGVLTDRDVALALAQYPDLASRSVADVMSRGAVSVTPDATLEEIRTQCTQHGIRRMLVVDRSGQLLGIISWSDIAARSSEGAVGSIAAPVLEQPSGT